MSASVQVEEAYVEPGMPLLHHRGRPVLFFEFWPLWQMNVTVML